jgi:CheY-like chemotaxis protein/HPt (histidine-containing phosphotransfer) domain-containing protein
MGLRLPLRILVAEDNAINQQVALLFLERLGYRADVAANGQEVLDSLRRQPYDVVLTDVQMPEMDGLEATRRIRQLPPTEVGAQAQPRVIAMTANALREDRDVCLAAGMDDCISKPVQVGELVSALSRCQPRQRLEGEAEPALPDDLASGAATRVEKDSGRSLPPVLDLKALERLRTTLGQQADAMLPGLIQSFYEDAERLLAGARQALEAGQAGELRMEAHSLKSTSATFGAMALSAEARELERLARDGLLEETPRRITRAETKFTRAKAELEAMELW